MLFVNFKTYPKGTGESAIDLVKILESISAESGVKIVAALQAADIKEAVESSKLEIWAQHVDGVDYGAHTGFILPEAVSEDGAVGTFLNHSEHKFSDFSELERAHMRAQSVGLKTLVFAGDIDELKLVLKLNPSFVSYEPPELVGSKTASVSQSKSGVVTQAVEICKIRNLPLIVGAGIKSASDVRKSVELGATGVAVASDIVAAEDPKREVMELVEGFK